MNAYATLSLCMPLHKSAFSLAVTLTFDLENIFSNGHSHDDYLLQVSLKSLHQVKRLHHVAYAFTDGRTMHGQTGRWQNEKHKPLTAYFWQRRLEIVEMNKRNLSIRSTMKNFLSVILNLYWLLHSSNWSTKRSCLDIMTPCLDNVKTKDWS